MNRSDDKPHPSAPRKPDAEPTGAFPEAPDEEAIVEHDPTLRWVLSDYDAPVNITPPPVTPSALTPPLQPVPPEWSAPLPLIPDAFLVPARDVTEPPASAPPQTASPTAPSPAPRPVSTPPTPVPAALPSSIEAGSGFGVVEAPARVTGLTAPTVTSTQIVGPTPPDFFAAEPTPPSPTEIIADILAGAAPVAETGAALSDSDLSVDAVEEPVALEDAASPPNVTEQGTASTLVNEVLDDDTPVEPVIAAPFVTAALSAETSTEPHEVEPEAVEMLESAEHPVSQERSSAATDLAPPTAGRTPGASALASTPPPVPVEAAHASALAASVSPASTPPPVPVEVHAPTTAPPGDSGHTGDTDPTAGPGQNGLFDDLETPPTGEAIPEALARRSLKKKAKPWYEEVFDEDFLRTLPFTTPEQTTRETAFIRQALAPAKGAELLDVGCGYGRHALELANHGFKLTGLDLSLPMLIRAADHAQRRGLAVNFVHADMREMTFDSQFDGAYCMLSSFGYFDEEANLRVANAICKALKPGGRFLLDIINRDYLVGDLPSRVWWEGDGCVVLEEVDFNFHTSRVLIRRSVVFGNGRQTEQEISLRAYSLHEVGKLLRQAGLRVLDVSGSLATKSRFFGAASRSIIALCERPAT